MRWLPRKDMIVIVYLNTKEPIDCANFRQDGYIFGSNLGIYYFPTKGFRKIFNLIAK